ncbi:MAG: alpha/beta fold hydrolase [Verrucomicrobia bacterium]|nr:alpha/beta fold hydrolase [Verrucomicrobiota bacterium]
MNSMERALSAAGFQVHNVDYPSRSGSTDQLSESVVGWAVDECQDSGDKTIHFVTHSFGGILVRSYLARHTLTNVGHLVMLGPPNQGSEVVDKLGKCGLFRKILGLAGAELGTDTNSIPFKLGTPDYSVGVIAGNRSLNWINSLMIPGRDDGKVSIERTKLPGMVEHVVVPATHPFLMRNQTAIRQTISFLRAGRFESATVSGRGRNAAQCPSLEDQGTGTGQGRFP